VLIGKLAYQQISAQIIVSPQLKLDYSSEEAYGEWTAAHGHCLRASGRWPPGGLIGKDVWHLRWDDCKKRPKGTPVLVPDPRRPPALLLLMTVQPLLLHPAEHLHCRAWFNLQMGQNPIRNPTNPFPPYKSSPPNQIQPSTLIIQTTPNHCIISSQTKLNCLTVHGFNPLESISQSMVSVHGFRALSSELIGFSLASLNLLSSVLYLLLAETWINVRSR
jgi:hypothetical protein